MVKDKFSVDFVKPQEILFFNQPQPLRLGKRLLEEAPLLAVLQERSSELT